ncbi:MAG: TIGR00725 family protein [Cyanobacteria bacterium J06626_23]
MSSYRRPIIGVMGPSKINPSMRALAYDLGYQVACHGWILLTGGRNVGVMAAASDGALAAGGLTVGVLPGEVWDQAATSVMIPIMTGMGNARNSINVLSSHVVVACGLGPGTVSEIALAIKVQRPVILLDPTPLTADFFHQLSPEGVRTADTVAAACRHVRAYLDSMEGVAWRPVPD